jgi:peptidoglycan/LPS O-acetylase OafA/YrhL
VRRWSGDPQLEHERVSRVETQDPPALRRLATLDRQWSGTELRPRPRTAAPKPMGYEPGLDGLRAISVAAVILYHAGFTWMTGGFFGVEVFFVVSGYLITALLLDEQERTYRVSLREFWFRRARRLLPALFTMLFTVALWTALFGTSEQQSTLKRDLPWSIFYAGNWGQIVGKVPYFASADPPLLRHLWSLAVEEQWYLIWPLVFVAIMAVGTGDRRRRGTLLLSTVCTLMVATSLMHGHVSNNALYLSTFTRASGLLLGAGSAFVWRPWRSPSPSQVRGRRLDPIGAAALTLLICIMSVASLTDAYIYQWLLPVVSILSMIVIAVVVYPAANGMRRILGWKPLVEVGRRSYGLYLWHWPIFVIGNVYHSGSWRKFVVAVALTAAVSELSYRYIETPIRRGALGHWFREQRVAFGGDRVRRVRRTTWTILGLGGLTVFLLAFYVNVERYDVAVGGTEASFSLPSTADQPASVSAPLASSESPDASTAAAAAPTAPATPTTAPTLPRRVIVVGDSQAHSLAINLPTGIDGTFRITDGSVEGCGVYDTGKVLSARDGFNRSFADCSGWAAKWGSAAASSGAEVALVVIGAWDVFDLQLADHTLVFGTPEADAYYVAQLQKGIDALKASGAYVALLEVPCMRPKDVRGAGVPALPERGDDTRTGHVNDLLKRVAAADPVHVTFIAGPTQWCHDETVSTDLNYRWDGVHVYKPGANLIYETIAPALLAIPVPAS